jgi:hypothetical protein
VDDDDDDYDDYGRSNQMIKLLVQNDSIDWSREDD